MPRSNRYILPGRIYHITHRCHNRDWLLKFGKDRDAYRRWLRDGVSRFKISILGYCLTSNHIHLMMYAWTAESISQFMQLVQGSFAQDYNLGKSRKGAFWEDRFHCTMIDTGRYLSHPGFNETGIPFKMRLNPHSLQAFVNLFNSIKHLM